MKTKKVYYADFETTQPNQNMQVKVYLWAVVSRDFETYGDSIEGFINFCKNHSNSIIYFHNLKFDFSYIHYYLLKNDINVEILEKNGTIYNAKFLGVELRDSMNFLPITLKEVGENYCTKYKKTSIDYNVDINHKATGEEIRYCINDCRVLEEGLDNYLFTLEEVLHNSGAVETEKKCRKKLTNAGIAFSAIKELSNFDKCCPKTTFNEYQLFKPAYKGGYVFSKPKGVVKNVQMIDCNSMYPYMYSTLPLPIGKPINCENEKELERFKFFIIKIHATYELREGYIPIIGGGVGKFGNTIYKASSNGEYENLVLCNYDFDLIKQFYDIDYDFIWGFGFETIPNFFKHYCDTFLEVKNKNKGVKRAVAKVLLNSPYGKMAMNGIQEIKEYTICENTQSVQGSVVGYELDEDTFQYLPMAIAITGGARHYLLTTAHTIGFKNVMYMDTDSVKFTGELGKIKCDPNILGAWKNEGLVKYFKTIAPKKYAYYGYLNDKNEIVDKTINITCAGFNKKVLSVEMYHGKEVEEDKAMEIMNMFDKGLTLECLQSKVVEGGRALIPVLKEMK